jgi:hypothetical protein
MFSITIYAVRSCHLLQEMLLYFPLCTAMAYELDRGSVPVWDRYFSLPHGRFFKEIWWSLKFIVSCLLVIWSVWSRSALYHHGRWARQCLKLCRASSELRGAGDDWRRRRSWGSAPASTWTARTWFRRLHECHTVNQLLTLHSLQLKLEDAPQRWTRRRVRSRSPLLSAAGRDLGLLENRHLPWRPRSGKLPDVHQPAPTVPSKNICALLISENMYPLAGVSFRDGQHLGCSMQQA